MEFYFETISYDITTVEKSIREMYLNKSIRILFLNNFREKYSKTYSEYFFFLNILIR